MNNTGYIKKISVIQGANQVAYNNLYFYITKYEGFAGTSIASTYFDLAATGAGQQVPLEVIIPGNVLVYADSVLSFPFTTGGLKNNHLKKYDGDYANGAVYYGGGLTTKSCVTPYFQIYIQPVTIKKIQ